ncbi:hypothetical protein CTM83_11885 [Photobacterium leiognathi subsp. mandapamensis]|nr:hypothetical protein CTM83_11885 [Photobacterium leiognathi subsp. mandapamensis]
MSGFFLTKIAISFTYERLFFYQYLILFNGEKINNSKIKSDTQITGINDCDMAHKILQKLGC